MLRQENNTSYASVNNNDLFNKVIILHLEAEGNKRNIRHVVKMFRLLTKTILWLLITVRH